MVTAQAINHLHRLIEDLSAGAEACMRSGSRVATLLFIMSSTELLSLYYVGSRRPAGQRGTRAFYGFLTHYFPRFNEEIRDARGRIKKLRVPLLSEGGKASKRLKVPSALIYLYRKGVVEDLVLEEDDGPEQVVALKGRWGLKINVPRFHEDFQRSLISYREDVRSEPRIGQMFLRRFNHLHGW